MKKIREVELPDGLEIREILKNVVPDQVLESAFYPIVALLVQRQVEAKGLSDLLTKSIEIFCEKPNNEGWRNNLYMFTPAYIRALANDEELALDAIWIFEKSIGKKKGAIQWLVYMFKKTVVICKRIIKKGE